MNERLVYRYNEELSLLELLELLKEIKKSDEEVKAASIYFENLLKKRLQKKKVAVVREKKEYDFLEILMFLYEMDNTNIVDELLEIIELEVNFFEEEFGKFYIEDMWQIFVKLGRNNIEKLFAYVDKIDNNVFSRTVVLRALIYLCYNNLERRKRLIDFLEKVLKDKNEESIFKKFVLIIADYIGAKELEDICSEKRRDFNFKKDATYEIEISDTDIDLSFEKVLEEELEMSNEYNMDLGMDYDESVIDDLYFEEKEELIKPKKIGRNDPCFCGSGKKYKKCCGKTN